MKKQFKKVKALFLCLILVLPVCLVCSPNSYADPLDSTPSNMVFTVGDVVTVRRVPRSTLPLLYRRDVKVEVEPSLTTGRPSINGSGCSQKERFAILVRKLLGSDFDRVTSVRFRPELPHPELIEIGYVSRDAIDGHVACMSVLNRGTELVVTLEPIDPAGFDLLCHPGLPPDALNDMSAI